MDLEPVYEDEPVPTHGVQVARVERGKATRTIRSIARVVPDENRLYPVVAGCEGWITRIVPGAATGDRVRRGQTLAIVYGREFATAERSFLYALKAAENPPPSHQGDEPALTLGRRHGCISRISASARSRSASWSERGKSPSRWR